MWNFFGIVVACTRQVKYAKYELFFLRGIQFSRVEIFAEASPLSRTRPIDRVSLLDPSLPA